MHYHHIALSVVKHFLCYDRAKMFLFQRQQGWVQVFVGGGCINLKYKKKVEGGHEPEISEMHKLEMPEGVHNVIGLSSKEVQRFEKETEMSVHCEQSLLPTYSYSSGCIRQDPPSPSSIPFQQR